MAYHLQFGGTSHLAFEDATGFFRRGYLLVDLFFILSGFILSYVNRGDRSTPVSSAEYRDFLGRRLIRLYPLLLFTLVVMVAFALVLTAAGHAVGKAYQASWDGQEMVILVSQALLLNAWTRMPQSWNIPSWSISAELFAYMLFPLIVSLHSRHPRLAIGLLTAIAVTFYAAIGLGPQSLDIVRFPAPFRCLAGFSLGMLIYYGRGTIAALPVTLLGSLQLMASGATIACLCVQSNDVLIVPAFAVLVATTWTDAGPIPWLIVRAPLLYLGDISYSVYLNHVPVINVMHFVWMIFDHWVHIDSSADRALWLISCYGATIIVSHFTYNLIEIPARRILNRRLLGHPARRVDQSVPAP